jgi:hypothetical protein
MPAHFMERWAYDARTGLLEDWKMSGWWRWHFGETGCICPNPLWLCYIWLLQTCSLVN